MGGQGCAARGHGYGPCVVRRLRHVVPSQVVTEGRFSRLVEQEFEEVSLVRVGQGGCMLHVFVGAVCELLRCLGNGRPLDVRRRGLGVLRVGA